MLLAPLSALLFLIGLTVSRVGLLLHELAGHAGIARIFGCRLDGVRLFAFGGGYVEYSCDPLPLAATLAIDFGGIALELVVGALLLVAARRRRGLLGLFLASAGLLFVLHAIFYALTGVHYGVGDGRRLHLLLGERRTVPLWIGSLGLVVASFWFARLVAHRLATGPPAPNRTSRVATLAFASLAAAGLHGALLLAEQRVVADTMYAASFTPEPRTLAPPTREHAATPPPGEATTVPDPEAQAPATPSHAGAADAAPFPLRAVLGAGMAIATLLGFASALRRAAPEREHAVPADTRTLRRAGVACALAIVAVLAVDRLL